MLRVYSILYIEKLWKPEPSTPFLTQVATHDSSVVEDLYRQEPEITMDTESDPAVAQEVHTDVHTAEEEAIEIIEAENTTEADQVVVKAEQEEETEEAEEELNNRLDSTMSVDDGVTQEEYKTTGLVIDTTPTKYVQEEVNITDSPLLEDGEEPTSAAIVATSFSSTISSILPPATPTSIHSNNNNDKSPTRQSLLRRETTKLNQKRKSLTKKLKQAIKNNGTTNKRNSV